MLRSEASPESFALDLGLPKGARLRELRPVRPIPGDTGGPWPMEIVAAGKQLAILYPPAAHDVQGNPVAASYELKADELTVNIEHRGRDVGYPILADPTMAVKAGDQYRPDLWRGWRQQMFSSAYSKSKAFTPFFGAAFANPAYGPGLYMSMPTGNYYGVDSNGFGDYSELIWQAPPGTYITGSNLNWYSHTGYYSGVFSGFANPPNNQWEQPVAVKDRYGSTAGNPFGTPSSFWDVSHYRCYTTQPSSISGSCNAALGPDQNNLIIGLQAYSPGQQIVYTGANKAKTEINSVDIFLGDRNPPFLYGGIPASSGWRDDGGAAQTITPLAGDSGFGLRQFELTGAATGGGTQTYSCTGQIYDDPCPKYSGYDPRSFTYTLNEGINNLQVTAVDVALNRSTGGTWTERIDRSSPGLTLGGSIWDAKNATGFVKGDSGTLVVDARDGYSGIDYVDVKVDGNSVLGYPKTQAADGGPISDTIPYAFADEQPHTFEVTGRDRAGHPLVPQTFTVAADKADPSIETDDVGSWDGDRVVVATGWDSGSGVRQVIANAPGWESSPQVATCDGPFPRPCPPELELEFDTGDLPAGQTSVTVTATDGAGRTKTVSVPLAIDRTDPLSTLSGSLAAAQGALTAATYELTVSGTEGDAQQPQSGVASLAVYVDDVERSRRDVQCSSASCPESAGLSWTFVTDGFADGTHNVQARVTDALGNVSWEEFDVVIARRGLTTVTSGELRTPPDGYLNGGMSFDVETIGADPGPVLPGVGPTGGPITGITTVGVAYQVGNGAERDLVREDLACTPALDCPAYHSKTWTVDAGQLPEGRVTLRGFSTTATQQRAYTDPWTVYVDRTAPAPPSDLAGDYDPLTDTAVLDAVAGSDPPLPDGSSGAGSDGMEYRYMQSDGIWSEWARASEGEDMLLDRGEGELVPVEVRSMDAAGNGSAPTQATAAASSSDDLQENRTCLGGSAYTWQPTAGYLGPDQVVRKRKLRDGSKEIFFNLPDCREIGGTQDTTPLKSSNKFRSLTGYRKLPGGRSGVLEKENTLYDIYDSLGQTFARIKHVGGGPGQWVVTNARGGIKGPGTGRTDKARPLELLVQGRGCMLMNRDRAPSEYPGNNGLPRGGDKTNGFVLVSLLSARFVGQGGRRPSQYLGIRGFMRVSDLRGSFARVNSFRTGCKPQELGLPPATAAPISPTAQTNVAFPFYYAYQGGGTKKQQADPLTPIGGYPRYANYNGYPNPARRRTSTVSEMDLSRPRVVKITANTTGVDAGGIVRAIMPVAKRFRTLGVFGYKDPNAGCRAGDARTEPIRFYQPKPPENPTAPTVGPTTWHLVRSSGIVGFVPVADPTDGYARDPTCGG